ncbi:MAG: class I SAM-dependent rRNA methyltransferase [Syntrophaceae bacterium]|nr:class I SAM-dependent rRNA methyltransferase [Syntrophaceae bacterium]
MKLKYPNIYLKSGRDFSLDKGHPWVFSGAVGKVEGNPQPGDIVRAVSADGKPLGLGFYNPKTDIAFRLLTPESTLVIDKGFWKKRLQAAIALRNRVIPPETNACRLVNAEGDLLPGLIVDRYGDGLVLTIGTAGMEKVQLVVLEILKQYLSPTWIYERSEGKSRKIEGLEDRIGMVYGPVLSDTITVQENGLLFFVDPVSGQKTGFFLDQRVNRERVRTLSMGVTVLNCFCYTGAFSVYAAAGGAQQVVSVDISESAVNMARHNLEQNGFSPEAHPALKADVFNYLRDTQDSFGLIILDPPAFAKSKKELPRATRGYKEINLQAVRRLKEGGLLATFSCSNHIDADLFQKIVQGAVSDAGKTAQLLQVLGPGPDHPVNLAHPEGHYLKGLLLRIVA